MLLTKCTTEGEDCPLISDNGTAIVNRIKEVACRKTVPGPTSINVYKREASADEIPENRPPSDSGEGGSSPKMSGDPSGPPPSGLHPTEDTLTQVSGPSTRPTPTQNINPASLPKIAQYGNTTAEVIEEYEFLKLYMQLKVEDRIAIGQELESLIRGCTFRERDCKDQT